MLDLQTCTLWTNIAIVFSVSLMLMCKDYSSRTMIFTAIWAALLVLLAVGANLTVKKFEDECQWKKMKEFRSIYATVLFLIIAWSLCYCRMHDKVHTMKVASALIAAVLVALYAFMMYYSKHYFAYFIPIAAWTVIGTGYSFYAM